MVIVYVLGFVVGALLLVVQGLCIGIAHSSLYGVGQEGLRRAATALSMRLVGSCGIIWGAWNLAAVYPMGPLPDDSAGIVLVAALLGLVLVLEWLAGLIWGVAYGAWARAALHPVGVLLWPIALLFRILAGALRRQDTASPDTEDVLGSHVLEALRPDLQLSETDIHAVMVARMEMVTLPLKSTIEEIRRVVVRAGHSRIPVYQENIDDIAGILHVKDLFRSDAFYGDPETFELRRLLRPPFYAPEVMKIGVLLREFQQRKTHMAVVVDEYGGTAGVVTLEDILEEIVGEIQDEYDVEEKQYRVVSDGKIIADARVNVYDLGEELGVEFPEHGDFETLGGFLTDSLGALPKAGQVIRWKSLTLTVKDADDKRVTTVEISGAPLREGTVTSGA